MCNLYTNRAGAAEIAARFKARLPLDFNASPGDVYPGAPGMVVRGESHDFSPRLPAIHEWKRELSRRRWAAVQLKFEVR